MYMSLILGPTSLLLGPTSLLLAPQPQAPFALTRAGVRVP